MCMCESEEDDRKRKGRTHNESRKEALKTTRVSVWVILAALLSILSFSISYVFIGFYTFLFSFDS